MKPLIVLICLSLTLTCVSSSAQSPSTDIWLMPLKASGGMGEKAVNITNKPGYDNQPEFSPAGDFIYFTSANADSSTDIFRYHIESGSTTQWTSSRESEFSPRLNPAGTILAVVRVDKDSAQRLYQITDDGNSFKLLSGSADSVAYFCWLEDSLAAVILLNSGMDLHLLNIGTGEMKLLQRNVGRSIQRYPGTNDIMFTTAGNDTVTVMRYHYPEGRITTTCTAPGKSADFAFSPDGSLLTADNGRLMLCRSSAAKWQILEDLTNVIGPFYRLSVSRDGRMIAVVSYSGKKP